MRRYRDLRSETAGALARLNLLAATFLAVSPVAFAAASEDWEACRQSDADRAVVACSRIIEAKPESSELAEAYLRRGAAYHRQGKSEQATADYGVVIQLDPKNPIGYYLRSFSQEEQNQYAKAIIDYAAAYRLDPKHVSAESGYGIIAKGRGETEQMIADFTALIQLDPQDVIAYLYRGCAYKEEGKYDLAVADYTAAIRLDPKNADAYFGRALAYFGRDWDRAKSDLDMSRQLRQSPTP